MLSRQDRVDTEDRGQDIAPLCPIPACRWGAQAPGLRECCPSPWLGCLRVTGHLERHAVEDASAVGHEPGTAPGVSPEPDCSCLALPRSQHGAAVGRSSSVRPAPTPAGFKSWPVGPAARLPHSGKMPAQRTLLLALLVLFVELLPTPAQQHRAGDEGAAPAVTPAPRRAPRGRWLPAALPAPGKAGECPAGGSGAPRPPRLYCLSDHGCPSAEKCCQSGQVRTCLLPTTGTAGSPQEMPAWGPGDGWDVGGGRCLCRVPLERAPLPGHTAARSISLCREPRLLPPRQQRQRGELRDALPQRHRVQPRGEVLRPRLLRPLHARRAR